VLSVLKRCEFAFAVKENSDDWKKKTKTQNVAALPSIILFFLVQ